MAILDSIKARRSYYDINKNTDIDKQELVDLISELVLYTPDSYNGQSQRLIIAFDKEHDALWDSMYEAFGGKVSREKMDGFKAGIGTVLFYYDTEVVKGLQDQNPSYADKFEIFAEQANGMLQFNVWTALREKNLGASLQHYNPVVDEPIRKLFNVPEGWKLVAQMPFGAIGSEPPAKEKKPVSERVIVKGL